MNTPATERLPGAVHSRPLPRGWRSVPLSDVCDESIPTRDPRDNPADSFRYVDITSVSNVSKQIVSPKTMVGKDAPSRARQVIRTGDVLIATTRPNLNAVALVPAELDGEIASTGFCVLRAKGSLDPKYLFWFAQTAEVVRDLSELVKGALYPAVTDAQIRAQWLPLPELREQQRIVDGLEIQMAAVERAQAAAEAQLEAAKVLPAAELRAVFASPQGSFWPRSPLGRVADLLASRSIASDGDTPVQAITTACLTEIGFSAAGVKGARMWRRDVPECVVSPDEVLVARSNTPELVGRASRFEGEPAGVVASDLTIRIRARGELQPGFLSGYLSFLYLSGYWKERSGGASGSMKKITREQIQTELIPVPPKATQQEVDARITRELVEARQVRLSIESQLATINVLPAALLRRAFSGEL